MRNILIFLFFLVISPILVTGQVRLPNPYTDYYTPINTNPLYTVSPVPTIDIFRIEERKKIEEQNLNFLNEIVQLQIKKEKRLRDMNQLRSESTSTYYDLPSFSTTAGTEYYRDALNKILNANTKEYSLKDLTFHIENAFFEEKLDKQKFDQTIEQIGKFLTAKMKESNYDPQSNTAKNFVLFEFFTQTMEVKGFKQKHFPFKYDFEDYNGNLDWSSMFVTKLIKTGLGQCHSMPLLYLILANEIGADAYLALSPNHSYIKFQDEKGKWYNIELTNGMFTVPSFILNSGFIKAEAIQNHIYMESLSKQELLSHLILDLAQGYVQKYGYDEFVENVINHALELYPNNINANLMLANFYNNRFQYLTKKIGINPSNHEELQGISRYPQAIQWLDAVNNQYKHVDDLGYRRIREEDYQKWLNSLQQAKNKQQDETIKKQFKGVIKKKVKDN